MKQLDVIVPVYRGLEATRRCIESVLRSENNMPFELVVINDASPEPAIHEWLKHLASEKLITLLLNENNLGFVGTANKAMQLHSERDIVLLNSDTVVANDWLDRLTYCATSTDGIGTITPFSNNATICSYPGFCISNELPAGESVASMDAIFSRVNAKKYIDIPTAVGFCMYISRLCINDVGYFDEKTFGRGYGEENDFSIRASNAGWSNVLAGDVFVFHEGGVSFSTESQELQNAALEKLLIKYPNYNELVSQWIQQDPPREMRMAVDLKRLQQQSKPSILFVAHGKGGGVYTHIEELIALFHQRLNFFLLEPYRSNEVSLSWATGGEGFRLVFKLPGQWPKLVEVLKSLGPQRIHYHQTMGHNPLVFDLPAALSVPYDITLHDYYFICPQIHLSDPHGKYCGFPEHAMCAECLRKTPAPGASSIKEWRDGVRTLLTHAERVFSPSRFLTRTFSSLFPKVNYVEALHPSAKHPLPEKVRGVEVKNATLRVACIGALSPMKGPDILEAAAIDARKRELPVEYHLIGYAHRALQQRPGANLTVHGTYSPYELKKIVARIKPDVFWFPATVPETFSYTLSEVFQMGYPVAVTDLGALQERVKGRPNSWVKSWTTKPKAWNDFFMELASASIPEAEPDPPDQYIYDYRFNYLPIDMEHSVDITLTINDVRNFRSHIDLDTDSLMVRALRKSREFAATNVWAGRLMINVPNPLKQMIKRKLENR